MAVVEYLDHGRWAEVVLNRPERRNAINGPLGEALAAAIKRAGDDDGIQAVLLRGADGAFCSGLDLKAFNADPPPDWMPRFPAIWRRAHKAIFECRKPIVVALERFAINGGAALALAADLLVTGETAFLQVGEVRQGLAAPTPTARWRGTRRCCAPTTTPPRTTGSTAPHGKQAPGSGRRPSSRERACPVQRSRAAREFGNNGRGRAPPLRACTAERA
ncbi:MAG: enoyl-CoA hydratase/isomerase family protein [Gammaproteobacteria bacterium]|nr:enoyl-CoA hydratase/isomerase family protein [Gammaproteobacteria bacterium]